MISFRIVNLGLNKLKSLFQHSWKDLADFQEVFMIIKNPVSGLKCLGEKNYNF